jgi:hypothetical protein
MKKKKKRKEKKRIDFDHLFQRFPFDATHWLEEFVTRNVVH